MNTRKISVSVRCEHSSVIMIKCATDNHTAEGGRKGVRPSIIQPLAALSRVIVARTCRKVWLRVQLQENDTTRRPLAVGKRKEKLDRQSLFFLVCQEGTPPNVNKTKDQCALLPRPIEVFILRL